MHNDTFFCHSHAYCLKLGLPFVFVAASAIFWKVSRNEPNTKIEDLEKTLVFYDQNHIFWNFLMKQSEHENIRDSLGRV